MATIRVAALMDTAVVSGPARQLVAVARALKEYDVETIIVTFRRRGRAESLLPPYAATHGVQCEVVEESGRFDTQVPSRVAALLNPRGCDVIQSHSYKPAAVAALIRRSLDVPWIGMFHGTTQEDTRVRLYNWIDRRLLVRADRIVTVSTAQRALFRARPEKILTIPNAVLQTPPDTSVNFEKLLHNVSRPLIAVIGRLSHEKGVDIFLDAMSLLKNQGLGGTALIVGDGPDRELLANKAQLLGETVRFLGHFPHVSALYQHLDLVVIPSRSEGMPNVLLEAVNADTPLVATTVGAIPDVVGSTGGAWLVPSERPDKLAEAIRMALSDIDSEEARRGRAVIAATYSLDNRARQFRSLYESVIDSRIEHRVRTAQPR